ncbi:hypothetical protein PLESTM_001818100, partial [Pleodorina starrii]
GDVTGITLHGAKLAYCRSLSVVVDDVGNWGRAVCLSRCGFMEALGRLAEELAPPPLEEVAEAMREAGLAGRELRRALERPWGTYYNQLPVELLVARRIAAAEAAAARSTTTGGDPDSGLPSVQHSTSRLPEAMAAPTAPTASASATATAASPNGRISGVVGGDPRSNPLPLPLLAVPPPPASAPPSSWNSLPKLSYRLEALLELLLGRLREHWECEDNQQLADRLETTAAGLREQAHAAA